MKRVVVVAVVLACAAVARAAVFERFLSPDRPADRAIMAYVKLANAGQASSRDLTELAVLLVDKGFPKDAETYLRQALTLDKKNFDAAYRLGLVLQRMGRDGEAVRAYKRALKVRPGHSEARFMLALAEERCGRRSEAIRDYAKAYHHNPSLSDPDRNPLVYDSSLQTEAELVRYRAEVAAATLKVEAVDPEAVKRMMAAIPSAQATPAAAAAPAVGPTPIPATRRLATPPPARPLATPAPASYRTQPVFASPNASGAAVVTSPAAPAPTAVPATAPIFGSPSSKPPRHPSRPGQGDGGRPPSPTPHP